MAYYKTRNTGTRNYRTQAERRNTGTLAEQRNTGRTIGIPRNSGTCGEHWNNVEILLIQNDDILSR